MTGPLLDPPSPLKLPPGNRMAEPVPPPPDIPLAAEAPPRLTAFLYYMLRDLVPPRYMDQIASHVQNHGYPELGKLDKGLADYSDRLARRLMYGYEPTEDGQ